MDSSNGKGQDMEYKTYIAKAGDTWDLIALRLWSRETLMHLLIAANPNLAGIVIFEGGEKVRLPMIEEPLNKETLPPWRR